MMGNQTKKGNYPELDWHEVVDRFFPSVFKIDTHDSGGTAFAFSISQNTNNKKHHTLLATAWHVLSSSEGTRSHIKITNSAGNMEWNDENDDIYILKLGSDEADTALIMVESINPMLNATSLLPILPFDSQLARGSNIGWLGYPGITDPELCFFSGHVSGYLNNPPTYLVDGVAVNGVSGGPVFDNRCHLVGMMTAYIPNQIDQTRTLPGLSAVTPINAIRFWAEEYLGARVI